MRVLFRARAQQPRRRRSAGQCPAGVVQGPGEPGWGQPQGAPLLGFSPVQPRWAHLIFQEKLDIYIFGKMLQFENCGQPNEIILLHQVC